MARVLGCCSGGCFLDEVCLGLCVFLTFCPVFLGEASLQRLIFACGLWVSSEMVSEQDMPIPVGTPGLDKVQVITDSRSRSAEAVEPLGIAFNL